jgi:hypothetical protein
MPAPRTGVEQRMDAAADEVDEHFALKIEARSAIKNDLPQPDGQIVQRGRPAGDKLAHCFAVSGSTFRFFGHRWCIRKPSWMTGSVLRRISNVKPWSALSHSPKIEPSWRWYRTPA